jgi:hypothetical protein
VLRASSLAISVSGIRIHGTAAGGVTNIALLFLVRSELTCRYNTNAYNVAYYLLPGRGVAGHHASGLKGMMDG